MKDYEINDATLAIIPETRMTSVVVEADYKYNVEGKPLKIIDYSCKYLVARILEEEKEQSKY